MKSTRFCRRLLLALGSLTVLLLAQPAYATDAVECDTTCEGGNKMVSYADGNSITCACMAESEMEPTVSDPAVLEGPVNVDTE